MDDKTTAPAPETVQYLPHDLILQILLLLPVESLMRFASVSKTWHNSITSDRCFQREHHRLQEPCVLIAPRIILGTLGVRVPLRTTTPGLYRWERKSQPDTATLVQDMDSFPAEEEVWRHKLAHCDGLVLVPMVEGTPQVLNLAMHRALMLPLTRSPRDAVAPQVKRLFIGAFGLGHDPRSDTYKVARFFYRSVKKLAAGRYGYTCGMEVFSIGTDQHWRETAVAPPCGVISGRTATFFNGSLLWTIGLIPGAGAVVKGFLRFSLQDESFSIIPAPPGCPEFIYSTSNLAVIGGELYLAHQIRPKDGPPAATYASQGRKTWIWAYNGADPPGWVLRHVVDTQSCIHLIATSDDDNSGVLFQEESCILECSNSRRTAGFKSLASMDHLRYRHPDTNTVVEYGEEVYDYDVIPYVPSLAPI